MPYHHQPDFKGYLDTFLSTTAGSTYLKDKEGKYLEVNQVFIEISQMQNPNEVIGSTDKDLFWSSCAHQLMENDKKVWIAEKPIATLEAVPAWNGSVRYYVSHKTPYYSNTGVIIGVAGISFYLDKSHHYLDQKELDYNYSSGHVLSKRQFDCLYYLVRGMSIKQIAKKLDLSPKTVEHYIEAVKDKMNCDNRSDLIAKALQLPDIKKGLVE